MAQGGGGEVAGDEGGRVKKKHFVNPDEIMALHRGGLGFARIAKHLGVSPYGVKYILARHPDRRRGRCNQFAKPWTTLQQAHRAMSEAFHAEQRKLEILQDHWGRHREAANYYARKYESARYQRDKAAWERKVKEYRKRHPERIRKRVREWKRRRGEAAIRNLLTDRLRARLSSEVRKSIKGFEAERLTELCGCSFEHLKQHIQSGFKRGMDWKNWGDLWHLDHIIPCAAFDLTDHKQIAVCFHWTNLRPLYRRANLRKWKTITDGQLALRFTEDAKKTVTPRVGCW